MPPQQIGLREDEGFHPQICVLAIESVSNYLLPAPYCRQSDAETCKQALDKRLARWSVTISQVTRTFSESSRLSPRILIRIIGQDEDQVGSTRRLGSLRRVQRRHRRQ